MEIFNTEQLAKAADKQISTLQLTVLLAVIGIGVLLVTRELVIPAIEDLQNKN